MINGLLRFLLFYTLLWWIAGCADGLSGPGAQAPSPITAPVGPPSSAAAPLREYRGPATRPFLMGFSQWPADLTDEGIAIARQYAETHGDIVSVMFIGGIPWQEALDGKPFSKDVQDNMSYRPPAGKKLLLAISPLNKDKRDLALYWGDSENQPLPKPWDKEPLNSPRVKKAFLSFVLRAVETMHPDYLAIGVESNVLLSRDHAKWQQLKELHRETYSAIKKIHATLPVFFSTEVLHYKRLARDAKGSDQEKEVADLMRYSDFFAMSLYPYMSPEVPRIIPQNFLDFAKRFKKGIAVTESGMSSRNVELKSYGTVLYGSDADQTRFTEFLLKTAERDSYEFVINFASTDSDRLVRRLRPPMADLARIWAYIGMQTSDRRPKPASAVWNGFFEAKYQPAKWW
jgi:glycosyl hydrolase family 53